MSFAAVLSKFQVQQNPYPGLRPFDTSQSHLFFGRDRQVAELVDRLARLRFVAVVGLSGSGKSSLVRAGLIPALRSGPISEARANWRVVITRPAGTPFESLAENLEKEGLDASGLRQSSHGLSTVSRQLPDNESLLLVVDQFEELFRYKERDADQAERGLKDESASEAAEFVDLLLTANRHHPPIYIVLTMRSDYLGDCAEFRDFPEALNESQYLVPRLTREQHKESIEGPLGRVGIAPNLLQGILNDASDEPDQLPVLQHALMRTWECANNRWKEGPEDQIRLIERADYRLSGGFESALNDHADELLKTTNALIAEKVFRRLTKRAADHRERRDPTTLEELWRVCHAETPEAQMEVRDVLDHFREGSATFLVPSKEQQPEIAPDDYLDITHESLIRQWAKMRAWMAAETEASGRYLEVLDDAKRDEAIRGKGGRGSLLSDPQLAMALANWQADSPTAAWASRYTRGESRGGGEFELARDFLERSRQARDQGVKRELARRKRRLLVLSVITGIAVIAAGYAFFMLNSVRQEHHRSLAGKLLAESLAVQSKTPADLRESVLLAAESIVYQPRGESIAMNLYALEQGLPLLPHLLGSTPTMSSVLNVGITHDGKLISASSWDGVVRIFKLEGNKLVEIWKDDSQVVWSSTFSEDGRNFATGDGRGTIKIYELNSSTPKVMSTFKEFEKPVEKVRFSLDGKSLAASGQNDKVVIIDGTTGTVTKLNDTGEVNSMAFSGDGSYVAIGDQGGRVRLFRRNGQLVPWAKGTENNKQGGAIVSVAFSPDGSQIATGGEDWTVRVYRSVDGVQSWQASHSRPVRSVLFSKDGRYVASGSQDATARVFDAGLGTEISRITHRGAVNAIAFSSNGRYLATGSEDRTARLFDVSSGAEVLRQSHSAAVNAVALSGDGNYLVSGSVDKSVSVWDIQDRNELAFSPFHASKAVAQMAVTYNGKYLVSVSPGGEIHTLDLGTRESTISSPPNPATTFDLIGVSTNAESVVIGGNDGWMVFSRTTQHWSGLAPTYLLRALDISADGNWIIASNANGHIEKLNARTSEVAWGIDLRAAPGVVLFSPTGRLVAVAGDENKVRILDATNGKQIADLDHTYNPDTCKNRGWQTCSVTSLWFSLDEKLIATGSSDRTARVYDVNTHRQTVFAHESSVGAVALSPDDKYLASSTDDFAGHIFETATGSQVSSLVLQNGDFFPLCFSRDDKYVLMATDLGGVRVTRHLWRKEDLLRETCDRVGDGVDEAMWKKYSDDRPAKICGAR